MTGQTRSGSAGGVLLALAGAWVICQVTAGDALLRLGLVGRDVPAGPPPGRLGGGVEVPVPDDGYGPGYRDGHGRPL